jgi:hypothetical protein
MLGPALGHDKAMYSTRMASIRTPPIVTLPIVALPIVARPIVALPFVQCFTILVSSSTFLRYNVCTIWRKTSGPAEAVIEREEVGDNALPCVRILSERKCR